MGLYSTRFVGLKVEGDQAAAEEPSLQGEGATRGTVEPKVQSVHR